MGGISIWQLVIVLGIVLLLFGTKRLRNLGGDLGSAIKGFKSAIGDEDKPAGQRDLDQPASIQHLAGAEQFNKTSDDPRS